MPTRIYLKTFDRCDGIEISLLDSGWLDRHQLVDEAIELLEKIGSRNFKLLLDTFHKLRPWRVKIGIR